MNRLVSTVDPPDLWLVWCGLFIKSHSPIEVRDDLPHCLSSTGGCWNNVLSSSSAVSPLLSTWSIHSLLSCCIRMNSSLREAERSRERGGFKVKGEGEEKRFTCVLP